MLPGDAESIQRAAQEATRRLGWTTEATDSGKFKLVDYPRRPTPALTIGAQDGLLLIDAELPVNQPLLPEAARILRSATEEILTGNRRGAAVSERSPWVAGFLDVLLPGVGAVYALEGDPSYDSSAVHWQRSFWWDVSTRFMVDLSAGMMLGYFAMRMREGAGYNPISVVVTEIAMLAFNRVIALVTDLPQIEQRNAHARSGLGAPVAP